tara:strand:+ start:1394 stop:1780 length:387 start_codon:yes stop_codon:yes gene_type:complete
LKNRAKCKLCEDIIESLHSQDYQRCRCGEIFVDGGKNLFCGASDWKNFIRVDDQGLEHIPKIIDKTDTVEENVASPNTTPLTKNDRLDMLKEMIAGYDKLPPVALSQPITHYDMMSALILLHEILRHP